MSQIIIGDEAIFQLNGNVSNHKMHPNGDPPEDFVYNKPSSGEKKLVIWIGFVRNNRLRSYFFDRNVNGQTYLKMLNNFVLS